MNLALQEIETWQYVILISSYLLGSFPTGYLLGKYVYKINLFEHGSKNVGATNSLRVLGKKAGLIVLIVDALKGAIPVIFINNFSQLSFSWSISVGFLAIFGHTFSPFIKFKGGKGVATSAGTFLALIPYAFASAMIAFLSTVAITRYVSLGSILASTVLPISCYLLHPQNPILWQSCLLLSIFIIFKHRSNIKRLINGEENKLNWSKR